MIPFRRFCRLRKLSRSCNLHEPRITNQSYCANTNVLKHKSRKSACGVFVESCVGDTDTEWRSVLEAGILLDGLEVQGAFEAELYGFQFLACALSVLLGEGPTGSAAVCGRWAQLATVVD